MNVLVFDDNIFFIKVFSSSLKKNVGNLNIFTSLTYEDAVNVVINNKIDIAFIDLKMPEKNGADFITYLNTYSKYENIRKVILTETCQNSVLKLCYTKAVDAYLFKEEVFKNFDLILEQFKSNERTSILG